MLMQPEEKISLDQLHFSLSHRLNRINQIAVFSTSQNTLMRQTQTLQLIILSHLKASYCIIAIMFTMD